MTSTKAIEENFPVHFTMHSYVARLHTFQNWPFKRKSKCVAEKMAKAGFYHTPTSDYPDCVTCFACMKELDGWEQNDDPFQEHEKHSSKCPFIQLAKDEDDMTFEEVIKLENARQMLRFDHEVESYIRKFERQCNDVLDDYS
ncbi:Baculoviral IAP repeat-containing protein 5.2-B [Trichoplax sp. H2]|nr:Baculoviral IAP repeat-containing protein 5.2-B [Trichoplax sp. H2]|eukprot:RDD39462.1 Baculoviral IAP repeat-containing protein 5.2-B [Trichoplax sp. H2]